MRYQGKIPTKSETGITTKKGADTTPGRQSNPPKKQDVNANGSKYRMYKFIKRSFRDINPKIDSNNGLNSINVKIIFLKSGFINLINSVFNT